ncbi:MAG: hypothetical protein QOH29_795 [Actinomycetota bacterium]|nr:hypothetical protein [Actinomycetota bacterium]
MNELQVAIERRDPAGVAAALRGVDEATRAEWDVSIRTQLDGIYGWAEQFPILRLARFGTAPDVAAAVEEVSSAWPRLDQDAAYEILLDRKPKWLGAAVDELPPGRLRQGLLAVGHGSIRPDEVTARKLRAGFGTYRWKSPLVESLVADGVVLRDDVFSIFAVPEIGTWLAMDDGWMERPTGYTRNEEPAPERTWRSSLVHLTREGNIDLERLLADCLAVFVKDARVSDLTWFRGLHAELKPTTEEMKPHTTAYLRLLAAEASFAVGIGQKALTSLLAVDAVDPRAVIDASEAPLYRQEKTPVVGQIKLLDRIAKTRPGLVDDCLARLALALEHERTDVQDAALTAIAKHGGLAGAAVTGVSPALAAEARAAGVEMVGEIADGQVQKEFAGLVALARTIPTDVAEQFAIPAAIESARRRQVAPVATFAPMLGEPAPPPIEDVEELVALMAELLEQPGDAMGVERMLAGAARTAGVPLDVRSRLGAPQSARATKILNDEWGGPGVTRCVAGLVRSWVTGQPTLTGPAPQSWRGPQERIGGAMGLLLARCLEVQQLLVRSEPADLLAEPTRSNGAIDGQALLERLASDRHRGDTMPFDLEVAALRLDRRVDGGFWTAARRTAPRVADHLRAIWASAASVRVHAHAEVVPPRDSWLKRTTEITAVASVEGQIDAVGQAWPLLTDHRNEPNAGSYYAPVVWRLSHHAAGWALAMPWQPDNVAALTLRGIASAMYPGMTAAPEAASMLHILADLTGSLGPAGHMALALGMLGETADVRVAAGDFLAIAATRGRLDPTQLAAAWLSLSGTGGLKLTRLVAALRPVVAEPLIGYRILETISTALPVLADPPARDLNALLGLANDLAARFGFQPPPAVSALAARGGTSRTVVEAKRLGAHDDTPGPERVDAAVANLAALLQAATDTGITGEARSPG